MNDKALNKPDLPKWRFGICNKEKQFLKEIGAPSEDKH